MCMWVAVFQIYRNANIEIQFPRCASLPKLSLMPMRVQASSSKGFSSAFSKTPTQRGAKLAGPSGYWALSPQMQQLLARYVNYTAVQRPYRVLRHSPFPIEDYLLQLFRKGALNAHANLPDDPIARALTPAD